jgi:glycerophosphoryl diester phosphodiesterase
MAYDIIKNDAPFLYVDFDMIKITSHRGFSKDVPENTIPAIEKSMEEQADYIEIDVRQTKEGELVLLHDENLRRTTGVNKCIWNVTYAEISELDAGKWLDEAYAGTKIPTLREVFELCKGKININMDLKYDKHTKELGKSVAALIDEYDMENQCVISSSDLTLLEQVKASNSKIRTGYITYRIEQNYYDNENIDFFSLNSYFITENLLQTVHEHGKEIHVWTVNTKHELERMKNLGVDNIITDNPSFAKQVLYHDKSNRLLVTLFRLMLTY